MLYRIIKLNLMVLIIHRVLLEASTVIKRFRDSGWLLGSSNPKKAPVVHCAGQCTLMDQYWLVPGTVSSVFSQSSLNMFVSRQSLRTIWLIDTFIYK